MTKTKSKKPAPAADDYLDLVRRFPLRPIRRDAEYDQAIMILKDLIARADGGGISAGESDYADALGQFIDTFERAHYRVEHELRTPVARLKYLMQQHGMKTAELGKLLG